MRRAKIDHIPHGRGDDAGIGGVTGGGLPVDVDTVAAAPSASTTAHLSRFGFYNTDLTRVPPPLGCDALSLSTDLRCHGSLTGPL